MQREIGKTAPVVISFYKKFIDSQENGANSEAIAHAPF